MSRWIVALAVSTIVGCTPASTNTPAPSSTGAPAATEDGGSPEASSAGTSTLSPDDQIAKFCQDLAAPFCAALFACCADPQTLARYGGTLDACKAAFPPQCRHDYGALIVPVVTAGVTSLDTTRLAACAAKLDGMKAGGAQCTRPPVIALSEDCVASFQGTIPPGQPCDAKTLGDIEYIPCRAGQCIDGTCQAYLTVGSSCDPARSNMRGGGCNYPDGEACTGTASTAQCKKRGAPGDACLPGAFSCESMACGTDGKCAPAAGDLLCKVP